MPYNDPFGPSSLQDPMMAGIGGMGAPAPAATADPAAANAAAQAMQQPISGVQMPPLLDPPTFSDRLISAATAIADAGQRSGMGTSVGDSIAYGLKGYNDAINTKSELAARARVQQLQEAQLMGTIRDRQLTELAMHQNATAQAQFREAYPQLAGLPYDQASKLVSDSITNDGGIPNPLGTTAPAAAGTPPDVTGGAAPPAAAPISATAPYASFQATLKPDQQAYLATLSPTMQAKALGYASGNVSLPSPRSPTYPIALKMAQTLNPNYNENTISQQNKVVDDFNTGEAGIKQRALNTAISHLGTMVPLIPKLGNYGDGDLGPATKPANYVVNEYKEASGDPNITNYDGVVENLSHELSKAYGGAAGGSDTDNNARRAMFSSSNSTEQLMGTVKNQVRLLGGVMKGLNDQYDKGMVPMDQRKPILTPESVQILHGLGFDASAFGAPGTASPVAAAGAPAKPVVPVPTDQQIEYTAKKYGMTVEQVKQKLGIQ